MISCTKCQTIPDIHPSGFIEIFTTVPQLNQSLHHLMGRQQLENPLVIPFQDLGALEEVCDRINSHFNKAATEMLYCATFSNNDREKTQPLSFPQFYSRVQHPNYIEIMKHSLFTSHMQPIITLADQNITGYEFLMRPTSEDFLFYPNELFEMARQSGLQSFLDSAARIASLKASASHLGRGLKRFINFLPSSIYDPDHCLQTTFHAVNEFQIDPNDLVFEVVETEKINDIDHLKKIFKSYQREGMKMALDDVGTGYATREMVLELKPDYAKLDRSLISFCDQDPDKQVRLSEMVSLSKDEGITLLAEGIERKEEVDFCSEIGISLGQGYYFGKPAKEPVASLHL
ncbi:EAL domain-containing protein [Pseudalkalibacillus hwajinpoensis]|uniref:EAL domain-containing protein n=1 Tax=Guptibacillus hwajinpoensis TaxID=208199 RepID=UPI001CFCB500|nr:EAL domain-containing protein [Pseudalkalibacillus hwajinpoensis]